MVDHIVVTEGLVFREEYADDYFLSNHFEAVLKEVINRVKPDEKVFISPGNPFECPLSEEDYAEQYLRFYRPELTIIVPKNVRMGNYLDTFDNAKLLRTWLEQQGQWPLEEVILYCNKPHALRSQLMFQLCDYKIKGIIASSPEVVDRKMPSRLWFYHYFPVHLLYEAIALVYDLGRWSRWRISQNS